MRPQCSSKINPTIFLPPTILNSSTQEWVLRWPGQVVLCVSMITWTRAVVEAISRGPRGLTALEQRLTRQIEGLVQLVRGSLSANARTTLGALLTLDVHSRDVVTQLAAARVDSVEAFEWVSQLRYYWMDGTVRVMQVAANLQYGFEYIGNTGRLVITPLTDRCNQTLMGALAMNLGGSPAGPAGTGKTESCKDLSKALAKQCVVFNCSEGLNADAMGNFFKGLAISGAWACFDEVRLRPPPAPNLSLLYATVYALYSSDRVVEEASSK